MQLFRTWEIHNKVKIVKMSLMNLNQYNQQRHKEVLKTDNTIQLIKEIKTLIVTSHHLLNLLICLKVRVNPQKTAVKELLWAMICIISINNTQNS